MEDYNVLDESLEIDPVSWLNDYSTSDITDKILVQVTDENLILESVPNEQISTFEVTENVEASSIEEFLTQPVTVSRYEYEMLNNARYTMIFSFISLLILIMMLFLIARRTKKTN